MASGVNIAMDFLTRLLYGPKAPMATKLNPTRTVFSSPLPTTLAINEPSQPLLPTGPSVPPIMIFMLLVCFLAGFLCYPGNICTTTNEPRMTSQRFVACLDYITDRMKDTSERIANGTSTITALANLVNQLNERFREYRLEVDACLDYISDRLKETSERITNTTSIITALANLVNQLNEQFREYRLEVEAEFKRYDLDAIAHTDKIKLLNDNAQKLNDQILELTRSNTTEQDSLRQQIRKLERVRDNRMKTITRLEGDNKFLKKQADEFTTLNDKYLGQIDEGRTRAALLQKELEDLTFKQDTTAGTSLFGRALGNLAKLPVQNTNATGKSATDATNATNATSATDKKTEADDGTKSSDAENPKAAKNKRRNQRRREQEKELRAEKARERAAKLAEEAAAKAAEEGKSED